MSEAGPLTPGEGWDLVDRLGAAYVLLAEVAGEAAAACGVTLAELVALAVLAGTDAKAGLSQTEWGRFQGVSRQRAHVVARGLAARGLCRVVPEGRASRVSLTPEGRRLTRRLRAHVGAAVVDATTGLAPADARRLSALALALIAARLPRPA